IAAAGVVLKALAAGDISSRESGCMLTVGERLGPIAGRAQHMKERREGRREGGPAAGGPTHGTGPYAPGNSENSQTAPGPAPLYSPVDSENAAARRNTSAIAADAEKGEGLYSPVNSAPEAAGTKAAAKASVAETAGADLYSPVNSAA